MLYGSLTRPNIIDMIGKELPQKEEGAYTIKIEPELRDKIEALIDDRQKRMEENENCLIYKDGLGVYKPRGI